MYSFMNDYSEGAHPRILHALIETNMVQAKGYGEDMFTQEAITLIKDKINNPNSDIHFFSGGTQTNLTVISAFLRPHEAAVAATTGHVLVHEAGAIEATGHKIIGLEVSDGKLNPEHIASALSVHTDEHMVKPKLVYISNSTEVGTIYTKKELEEISRFCRDHQLYLFIDGARLGSALSSSQNDLTLPDLARLSDAFYIGGTKNGALIGEALVINTKCLQEDFRFHMKQKGALLAKGKVLSLQFLELFKDNLFFDLATHANQMAWRIQEAIDLLGYKFLVYPSTNQLFPILPNSIIQQLEENYQFYRWSEVDKDHSSIRLVTSWATTDKMVTSFIEDLQQLTHSN